MLSKVRSFKVFIKYWTSMIIVPFLLKSLIMQVTISFRLSECANTFDAKIKSAFFFNFLIFFWVKKPLKVFILFLFASLAKFFAGSIPKIFLNFLSKNGFKATPSVLPTSMI